MAKLVVSIEAKGAAFYVTHVIPPCADGTPNAAALAAFLARGREVAPEAYDPTNAKSSLLADFGRGIAASACVSEIIAQRHHDEAEAPNPLNTADTVGPSEG